jgi:hypothetical protein
VRLGPPQVHAQQHFGPVLRLGAARSRLDVEVGVVGIHLTGKHAPELETGNALLEAAEVTDDFGDGRGVVFFYREFEQFTGIGKAGRELVETDDDLFQLRPFLPERLRTFGLVPDIGLLELALDFGQALGLRIVVKDTSSTHRSVR